MPTEIRQIDDEDTGRTVLRVEGEMLRADAELLERLATGIVTTHRKKVVIDLADLDLLDSEAASVLRRLDGDTQISIEGIEIFLQTAIDSVERGT